jgi:hypothetical protein
VSTWSKEAGTSFAKLMVLSPPALREHYPGAGEEHRYPIART